ncbi:L-type lectin-domain containing receptor kinase S.6 [Rutidosis leptorrhynchoides]|uniref:L-type lectin-domain containing receptor kinase S.6 n=1 Tax=Rutidosis leptorrhynchoides TaxID=125765 RepID=UPI003A995557
MILHTQFFFVIIILTTILTLTSSSKNLTLIGSAHFSINNTIILTQHSTTCNNNNNNNNPPSIGRILHSYPIQFLNSSSSNATVSFSTRFTFKITRSQPPCLPGDGIAFLIASNPNSLPHSDGYLGLPDSPVFDPFFAIEFDTFYNPGLGDINDNHLGVDVNSVISVASVDLIKHGIDLKSGKKITVWIEYRDPEKTIRVWVGYSDTKPRNSILTIPIDVSKIFQKFMYVGFSGSNSRGSSTHSIERLQFRVFESLTPNVQMETKNSRNCLMCFPEIPGVSEQFGIGSSTDHRNNNDRVFEIAFVMMLLTTILIFVAIVLVAYCYCSRRRSRKRNCKQNPHLQRFNEIGVPKKMKLNEITLATKGFDQNRIIGEGASSIVYEANIPSCGNVAVKRFSKVSQTGSFGNQFATELATMVGCLRHKNLVQLHGWCCEGTELVLVYEYMPNGSLDKILHKRTNANRLLTFDKRLNILLGVSSALVYLHEECERQIIHRDVKTCNIMLDADFNAKLGDFGLAEVYEHSARERDATLPAGTMGYLAPEYVYSGVPSVKTDVFSFGVVVLEVASGQRPVNEDGVVVTDWVWDLWEKKILIAAADPNLMGRFDKVDMERMLMAGLVCVHPNSQKRPTMKEAGRMLRGGMVPELPLKKPVVKIQSVVPDRSPKIGGDELDTPWSTPRTHFSRAN